MNFLAPFFLGFTALLAVPVVIHLYGRSRARPRPFPTLDFLLAAHRRVASRTKLRQLLLLLLRALVMAAVPLILAKPFIETESDLPVQVSGAQSAVLIIDDSLAMNYQLGRTSLLARAKARAARIVDALGSSAEAAVVLGSRGAIAPLGELSGDRARISRVIAGISPSSRPVDLPAAVRRAGQILSAGSAANRGGGRRIYLLSTLSAHSLDPLLTTPPDIEIVPVDVADGQRLPNQAVVELHVDPAPGLGPTGVRVTAEVANHADEALKDLPVTLWVDGKAVARGLLDLQARGRAVKRFYHALGRQPGATDTEEAKDERRPAATARGLHDLSVQLRGDALTVDDRRYLRVEVQRRLRVLLLDGDPRNLRRDDEVFYVEMALHPGDRDDAPIETTTLALDDLGGRPLGEYDAIVLCNAKAGDISRARLPVALRDYISKGGGLLIGLGDNVDADAYNAALAEILPQPLAGAKSAGPVRRADEVEGEPPRETAPGGAGERIGRLDRHHPLLQPFLGAHAAEGLQEARFNRYMLLRPTPRTTGSGAEPAVRALLSFDTGAPALLERPIGAGRVLLFTSTLDREWNDLPIQPAFLPLMQQAVRYLARAPLRDPEPPALVGQLHEIKLRDDDARVEVTMPSGQKRLFERERLQGRRVLSFTDTFEPGLYGVAAAGDDRVLRPRPGEWFVVNVDPAESDLHRASEARLQALTRPLLEGRLQGAAPRRRVELWHGIGALLLILLLGEALLLREK